MPLFSLHQLHAGEWLEEKAPQLGNPHPSGVDEGVMFAADAADLPLIGHGESEALGETLVDAVSTRPGVDQSADPL